MYKCKADIKTSVDDGVDFIHAARERGRRWIVVKTILTLRVPQNILLLYTVLQYITSSGLYTIHSAFSAGSSRYTLFQSVQTDSGNMAASYSTGSGRSCSGRQSGPGVKLTTHRCLVLRLKMSSSAPQLLHMLS
jgi:hypothetical protein